MPTSRSPSRAPKPAPVSRSYRPLVLIGLAAVLAVIVATLPASVVAHFLPASIHAEDFSGSIWHGSAGKISVMARDAGALEWRLHPAALLGMAVAADLHWVKVGFVLDADNDAVRMEEISDRCALAEKFRVRSHAKSVFSAAAIGGQRSLQLESCPRRHGALLNHQLG